MKICILSEKRTGSTYLCELLNGTKLFKDKFREWFVKYDKRDHVVDFYTDSKEKVFNKFNFAFPDKCKIHWSTMQIMFDSFDDFIKNAIDHKFILIERNEIDMTVSQFIASKTDWYEIRSKDQHVDWISKKIKYKNKELIDCYYHIKYIKNKWKYELDKRKIFYIVVKYENLLASPNEELKRVFQYLGLDFTDETASVALNFANKSLIKQNHPIKNELYKKLKFLTKIC